MKLRFFRLLIPVMLFSLIVLPKIYCQSEIEKEEFSLPKNHPHYEIVQKMINYSRDGVLLYTEIIFKEKYKKAQGRIRQIDYYDSEGNPNKYEIFFTDAYCQQWGIKKTEENYSGEELTEIIYTFYNDKEVSFSGKYLQAVQQFSPASLAYKNSSFPNRKEFQRTSETIDILHLLEYGASFVEIPADAEKEPLNEDEEKFVSIYFNSIGGFQKYANADWWKIKAKENGKEITLYFNSVSAPYIKFEKGSGIIFFTFCGGIEKTPFNMINGSFPVEE